jgi:hypothetical protein
MEYRDGGARIRFQILPGGALVLFALRVEAARSVAESDATAGLVPVDASQTSGTEQYEAASQGQRAGAWQRLGRVRDRIIHSSLRSRTEPPEEVKKSPEERELEVLALDHDDLSEEQMRVIVSAMQTLLAASSQRRIYVLAPSARKDWLAQLGFVRARAPAGYRGWLLSNKTWLLQQLAVASAGLDPEIAKDHEQRIRGLRHPWQIAGFDFVPEARLLASTPGLGGPSNDPGGDTQEFFVLRDVRKRRKHRPATRPPASETRPSSRW